MTLTSLPPPRGYFPFVAQLVLSPKSSELHLLVDRGDGAFDGWAIVLTRPSVPVLPIATIDDALQVAADWSVMGSVALAGLVCDGPTPEDWARHGIGRLLSSGLAEQFAVERGQLEYASGETAFIVTIDRGRVAYGWQSDRVSELFLEGARIVGVLFSYARDRSLAWTTALRTPAHAPDYTPHVMCHWDAPVTASYLGWSALPPLLEAVIPPAFRYWEADNIEELGMRLEALRESDFLAARHLRYVDGALRRVEVDYRLSPSIDVPPQEVVPPARESIVDVFDRVFDRRMGETLSQEIRPDVLAGATEVFGRGDIAKAARGTLLAYDAGAVEPGDEATDGVLQELVKAALPTGSRVSYAITAQDTPEARRVLAQAGTVLRVRPSLEGPVQKARLLVTSFGLEPWAHLSPAPTADENPVSKSNELSVRLLKAAAGTEERVVFGIVLEPETTDLQGEIYDAEVIRATAYRWMERYRNMRLQHEIPANERLRILESYIAPCDFTVEGQSVKAGSWLLRVRILDDNLWSEIKAGKFTGFSIFGKARAVQLRKARKTAVIQGIRVVIDRPAGYVQEGVDEQGNPWTRTYLVDYGYIAGTDGGDGEALDVFLGPNPEATQAYWVVQRFEDGSFDELKLLLGFDSPELAWGTYTAHVPARFMARTFETPIDAVKALVGVAPAVVMKRLFSLLVA